MVSFSFNVCTNLQNDTYRSTEAEKSFRVGKPKITIMKEENSNTKIEPSQLEPNDGKPGNGGGRGISALVVAAIIGLVLIIGFVIIYVSTTGGTSGGGGTTGGGTTPGCTIPTVNSYNMGNGAERIHIQIRKVKVDVRKDNGTPKDDVFFVAAMYHDGNPTEPQLLTSNSVFKIHKNDIGSWVTWGKDLTDFTSAQLIPQSTIAFVLYDKDPGSTRQNWQYTTNRCLRYPSKENAYGTIYMSFDDFNGMQTGDTRTFNMAEGEIEVSIIRGS